ncbi:hypothetical protein CWB99_02285 [Pseudoalteromonas rubra]|uniref:Beta/gamma crystallin 'Greek key' domain-containing protein n=1 Tax=Pseudoalteromonas rubra TaxID=43658 RepID=A0A5S3WTL8_9GAMM|nr:beta/gamma crystallin-related protein [Pseudoalteromonas rubra]TMP32426.1 hypothetical protein CWB99_02285 [Pseudoalteromonas rubra]TMP36421.1 hypothetical protein CWC00_02105 [Pseudoalteromonas rubra]
MKKQILALVVSLASAQSFAGATIYEHSYMKGERSYINDGELIDAIEKRGVFRNDSISSLKVDYGSCAVLYRDAGYSSTAKYFQGGTYVDLVNYGINDTTSSIQVFKSNRCDSSIMTHFRVHRDYRTGGGDFSLPPNSYLRDLEGGNWHRGNHANDKISSIIVGDGVCVKMYEHYRYTGIKKEFNRNVATLDTYSFNDKASSVKVTTGSCSPSTPTGGGGVINPPDDCGGFGEICP